MYLVFIVPQQSVKMNFVCMLILLCTVVLSSSDDQSRFTSTVLKKTKSNYLEFAGKTYYFGNLFTANFYKALQFCRQQGMHLVSISSEAENTRLGRYVEELGSPHGHFWTSGANIGDTSQWVWLSTGNNIIYYNWHPGEPNGLQPEYQNKSENCIEARHFGKGFTWNDINCFSQLYFICESTSDCRRK